MEDPVASIETIAFSQARKNFFLYLTHWSFSVSQGKSVRGNKEGCINWFLIFPKSKNFLTLDIFC